jgi:hypothetical protein
LLAKEYIPVFEETDLINLDKYHIYVKMSIDGVTTIPFSATNVPPYTETTENHDKVVKISQQKFGQPRETVEENIHKANVSAVEKLLNNQQPAASPQQTVASQQPKAESLAKRDLASSPDRKQGAGNSPPRAGRR